MRKMQERRTELVMSMEAAITPAVHTSRQDGGQRQRRQRQMKDRRRHARRSRW